MKRLSIALIALLLSNSAFCASFASSYIPTTTAPVTRQPTSLTRSWNFPANNFSGQIKVRPQTNATDTRPGYFDAATFRYDANNFVRIAFNPSNDRIYLTNKVSGTLKEASTSSTQLNYVKGDLLNIRFRKDTTGLYLWVSKNGAADVEATCTSTDCKASFSSVPSTIRLADDSSVSDASSAIPMIVESLTIYNEAKSDAFLEALQ